MKFQKNKAKATIAFVLVLTMAAALMTLPKAYAVPEYPTYAFITVEPNPVGVGQTVAIIMWLSEVPPTSTGIAGGRWQGYAVTITKPDGTNQTLGPYQSDPVGEAYVTYAPDQIGTYTFQFKFPGQLMNGTDQYGHVILANYDASSAHVSLVVQQQQIGQYPTYPLPGPNTYWSRPIEGENYGWQTIGGNWLMQSYSATANQQLNGGFNPYAKAPNTAHIVWTKPLTFGGIVGGDYGNIGYYTGLSYEFQFTPPIIMNGVLYYNTPYYPQYGFYAVDLRTGQTLWWHNGTNTVLTKTYGTIASWPGYPQLTLGELYDYESINQHGVVPYLWAINGPPNRYDLFDAVTGNWILSFTNATLGINTFAPAPSAPEHKLGSSGGDLIVYVLDGVHNWLAMWNSSKAILSYPGLSSYDQLWRPAQGVTLNWLSGIQWNVTTPVYQLPYPQTFSYGIITPSVLVAVTGSTTAPGDYQMEIAYSATDGHVLWVQNRTTGVGETTWGLRGAVGDGVFTEFRRDTMQWFGYSLTTGEQIWGPTEPYTSGWGMYNGGYVSGEAYGKLYGAGYDGMVHCYDVYTGKLLWTWGPVSSGFETPYGVYPLGFHRAMSIADGKVFIVTGEHSPASPLYRGAKIYAIDCNTGTTVWNISGWMQNPAIADGYLVTNNGYDNKLYCFGMGQSATTVSATPGIGNVMTIQGTVTDQSPGQTSLGMPAAGTPAVSDASMEQWMEYLYMQKPMPTSATGVQVTLYATGPNGNTQPIGSPTTDISGHYATTWTPTTPGLYTISATFAGTNSYYSSTAETSIAVSSAASAAPGTSSNPSQAPQPTSGVSTTMYIVVAAAVVIILVAVAAVALRRRK